MSHATRLRALCLTVLPATAVILLAAVSLSGCALMNRGEMSKKTSDHRHSQSLPLPRIRKPRTAIQLEIVFIDRPADDPLLGPKL